MFPEVQRKAQEEVDRIVSSDELPSGKHLKEMKYINCTAKETVRCEFDPIVGSRSALMLWFKGCPLRSMERYLTRRWMKTTTTATASRKVPQSYWQCGPRTTIQRTSTNRVSSVLKGKTPIRPFSSHKTSPNPAIEGNGASGLDEESVLVSIAHPPLIRYLVLTASSGMHVAHNTLLLSISRILWAFDIQKAKDADGKEIEIDRDAFVGGLFSCEKLVSRC